MKITWEKLEHDWRMQLLSHAYGEYWKLKAVFGENEKPQNNPISATTFCFINIFMATAEKV